MDERANAAFFADADEIWERLPDRQRHVITQMREMLARLDLPYARPEGTRTTIDEDDHTVWLQIKHTSDSVKLAVMVLDDEVVLHWPGGRYSRSDWDSALADALQALLTGRNVVHMQRHFRTVVAVDTQVWLDGKVRRWLPPLLRAGRRRRLLRRLPWEAHRVDSTISFMRPNALAAAADDDLV
jgi:hypothetical protein